MADNLFDSFDPDNETATPAPPAVAQAPQPDASKPDQPNVFDRFDPDKQPLGEDDTSSMGTFGRSAERSVIPAAGGLVGAGIGAEAGGGVGAGIGAAIGLPFGGVGAIPGAGAGALVGSIIGGVAGAFGGSYVAGKAQDWGAQALPDDWKGPLGGTEAQQAADLKYHPTEDFLGGMVPYVLTLKPGGFTRAAGSLPANATAFQRIATSPITSHIFGGAIMGGMELGNEVSSGQTPDWTHVAISTGMGVVFNEPNRVGVKLTEMGAGPTRAAAARLGLRAPETEAAPATEQQPAPTPTEPTATPEPTVAQAADAKVMGPGITEDVFMGSHQQAPDAAMTAQDNARTEASLIGSNPEAPDINAVARRMEPDTFQRYDELAAHRQDLQAHISSAETPIDTAPVEQHLASIDAEMRDMAPQIAAAYRRASDVTGSPTVEPEAPSQAPNAPSEPPTAANPLQTAPTGEPSPAGPIAASTQQQAAAIAEDVTRQLIAAGRSPAEAQASGQLIGQHYVTRAARMNGVLGSPQDLYNVEGASIRAAGQPAPPKAGRAGKTPAPVDPVKAKAAADKIGATNLVQHLLPTATDKEISDVLGGKLSEAQVAGLRQGAGVAPPTELAQNAPATPEGDMTRQALAQYLRNGGTVAPAGRDLFQGPADRSLFQTAPAPDTPEFKNWFGGSKVVDEEGHPKVVYHATSSNFDEFKPGAQGRGMSSGPGVWFSDDPKYLPAGSNVGRPGQPLEGENVIPAYLSLKNPMEMTQGSDDLQYFRDKFKDPHFGETGWGFPQLLTPEVVADLKETGFDGIIYHYNFDGADRTEYVAFDPTQIKSTFNRGTFDPNDPRILAQKMLGSIVLNPNDIPGRNFRGVEGTEPILTLARTANASSFIHETGHQWLAELMRDIAHPAAGDQLKADGQTIKDWLGMAGDDITRRQHEKFARGFEQYMREGVAPSAGLARVFSQFKSWLTSIYQTIKGLGTPISDDIKSVFDRLIAEEPNRTVLAPEREEHPSLASLHEQDAADAHPAHAEPIGDRIVAERDRYVAQQPPEVQNELARADAERTAAEPGAEAGAGENGRPEVGGAGGQPESEPAVGNGGGERGAVQPGSGQGVGQGTAVPAGAEPGTRGNDDAGLRDNGPGAAGNARSNTTNPLAPDAGHVFGPAESPFVDLAGNVRIDNLTTNADVAQAIRDSADANNDFIGDRRGVITDGQVLDLADALGMDAAQLNQRQLGQAFNAEQVMAARKLLIQSATDVSALMKKAATGTDEDVLAYAQGKARHQMIQGQVAGITAEAGRALRAFRDISGTGAAQGIDQFLRSATGKTLFQLREEAKLGSSLDTPQKVSKFVRDAQKRGFWNSVLEYWINGLISGPATHTTYMVGNTILAMEKAGPETAAAAIIGAARRAMGREGNVVHLGEVGAQFRAAGAALPMAGKAALDALRTGVTTRLPGEDPKALPFQPGTDLAPSAPLDESMTYAKIAPELFGAIRGIRDGIMATGGLIKAGGVEGSPLIGLKYSPLGAIPNVAVRGIDVLPVGTAVRLPSRFVASIHSFFRATNYSMDKAAIAYRTATEEGLTGPARDARVGDLRQNPTPEIMDAARTSATQLTLMGKGSEFVQALSKLTNVKILGIPMLKFVSPFVHIAGNIIDQSLVQRTPVGLLAPSIREDLMGKNGNIAQDTAMARMLVGTGMSIAFGSLAAEGLMSGSGPSDPDKAAMWRLAGNQAHSIRIGDSWYDVHRLGPMGMLAGVAADMYDVSHLASDGDMQAAAASLQHAFTQNILDESFMSGPSELIQALEDPGRYGQSYIRNFLSSFVPYSVGMSQMARAADPYSRQARTIMDSIKAKVPGMSEQLMPRRDIWGNPLPNLNAVGGRALSAIYIQPITNDPVNQAMLNLGMGPASVERKLRGVALTDQQYDYLSQTSGRMAKQRLDQIVGSSQWRTWPPETQVQLINETIRQSRETARGMTMMRWPSIISQATQQKLAPLRR